MVNETTILPTTEEQEKDIPYWMIIIWCVAGFLVVVMIIVAIYYTVVNCCLKKTRIKKRQRPPAIRANEGHPMDNYPRGFINLLHNGDTNTRCMFSPSFVDHMRIPRAMEVKMLESVNSINHTQPVTAPPQYASPCLSPRGANDYFSAEMFSFSIERVPPSRQQSFRYSNMSTEENKERLQREKMVVSELREKLRNQRRIDE